MRSIIIGGGVSGCAVAAALRGTTLEHEAVVLEREQHAPLFDAGVLLNPSGLSALEVIAPEYRWRNEGRGIHGVSLRSRSGRQFSQTRVDHCVAIQSSRFIGMLRDAARATGFLEGWCFTGLGRDAVGAIAHVQLADGGLVQGDAFFACDGAQSLARHLLFPESRPADVVVEELMGVAVSRSLVDRLGHLFHKFHDEEGGLAVELLPLDDERVGCFLQFDPQRWTVESSDPRALQAFAIEHTIGWAPEVRDAFASIDYARSRVWQTRDLPPLERLGVANAVLVGDAGHAALPFTSQSPNDALADAALLGNLLHRVSDRRGVEAAFHRYSELRFAQHRRTFADGRTLCAEFLAPVPPDGPPLPLLV